MLADHPEFLDEIAVFVLDGLQLLDFVLETVDFLLVQFELIVVLDEGGLQFFQFGLDG
jgi:hypothetical protein